MRSTWFWDLAGQYPTLEALNPAAHFPRAKWVTINPFAPDQHFIVFEDNTTHYSLPPQWAGDIAQLFQQYARQTVQDTTQPTPPQLYGVPLSNGSPCPNVQAGTNMGFGYTSFATYNSRSHAPFAGPPTQPHASPPDKKPKFWQRKSSQPQAQTLAQTYASPPITHHVPTYQSQHQPNQPVQGSFDINGTIHLANSVFDAYNNVTNGSGQTTSSPFDAVSYTHLTLPTKRIV